MVTFNYKAVLTDYMRIFPEDEKRLGKVLLQVSSEPVSNVTNRRNFVGHITASAFVIAKKTHRVVMIHHKALRRYLQPGGHVEPTDVSPLATAKRELREETGITADNLHYCGVDPLNDTVPFNVSVHQIFENPIKQEAAHYHYDFQYIFLCNEEMDLVSDKVEVDSACWVDWETFKGIDIFCAAARRMERVMASSPDRFLARLIRDLNVRDCSCVAIQHIVPSAIPFIRTLWRLFGDRLRIYAKPSSINTDVWDYLTKLGINLETASRELEDPIAYYGITDRVVLIDIGGYFSKLATMSSLPIVGIIEDTENGLQRYERALSSLKYPVFSVARNELKENEDLLVGENIVFGADYILRLCNKLISYMSVACIGYGKIGMGICSKLQKMGVKPKVLESDDIRAVRAVQKGCDLLTDKDFAGIDVIFCATGSQSLNVVDFRSIKSGTYLVLATSSDDEFDLRYVFSEYTVHRISDMVMKYENEYNYFYVVNNGIPTNFVTDSALGNFILLVHAAILTVTKELLGSTGSYALRKIHELGSEKNKEIAHRWLEAFYQEE